MRRIFGNDDYSGLESELRDGRPEPRRELVDALVSRVERVPSRREVRRPRLAAALAFAVVVLAAFGAFGGIGYAKSSVVSAARSSGNVVSAVVGGGSKQSAVSQSSRTGKQKGGEDEGAGKNGGKPGHGEDNDDEGNDDDDDPPFDHQYSRFVLVCYPITFHNRTVYVTIVVPRRFVDHFVPPGTIGPCRVRR